MPEISITRTTLMIWPEPLEHIDQGVFIFLYFSIFAFDLVFFKGRHQLLPLPHRYDSGTSYNFYRGRFRTSRRAPPPSYVKVFPGRWWYVQHTWNLARRNFDLISCRGKQVLSASNSLCGRTLYYRVHSYASRQTAGSQQSVQTLI